MFVQYIYIYICVAVMKANAARYRKGSEMERSVRGTAPMCVLSLLSRWGGVLTHVVTLPLSFQ